MRFPVLLPVLFLALTLGARAADAGLTVVGSDLLGPAFATGVADFAKRANLTVKLDLTGSRVGLESLQAGTADLALLVFAAKETPPGVPFIARPVAYHTAVVVVPASLTLTEISFTQLRAIFGENEGVDYKRWNDLGVKDEWISRSIVPIMSGGSGISYDLFRYTVLTSPNLRPSVLVEPDGAAALRRVALREGGIAIVPKLPKGQDDQLKVLPVARGIKDVAFGPTPENVHSGDYPLRLPVYVVFRADAAKRLLPLLRFLYSAEAVPLWDGAQLVPLPQQARLGQTYEFEAL